jgi:hypothetical protein
MIQILFQFDVEFIALSIVMDNKNAKPFLADCL